MMVYLCFLIFLKIACAKFCTSDIHVRDRLKLMDLHSRLPLPLVALACGLPYASLQSFRPFLTGMPLPSAYTYVNKSEDLLTGFTYRELVLH